jgi:putative nucleotidyltransferase with HDIG domain
MLFRRIVGNHQAYKTLFMTAIALVQKVKNFPPVSQAALKMISLLDKASVDNDDIVQVLKYDNVLTAKLLKACNAPSFGLGEPVASVDQAVLYLGHEQIHHIVMTLAFGSVMTVASLPYTMEVNDLWQHSVITATAVETVLDQVPQLEANTSVAFTASLLHDIGKLVFGQALTAEQLSEIRDLADRKQISGTAAEKEILGVDHAETGAALLQNWRLPESIVEAVGNHHRPALKPEPRLSTVVHISNVIAHQANPPPGQNPHDLRLADEVAAQFGLNAEKLEGMSAAAKESFEHVDRFMAMV